MPRAATTRPWSAASLLLAAASPFSQVAVPTEFVAEAALLWPFGCLPFLVAVKQRFDAGDAQGAFLPWRAIVADLVVPVLNISGIPRAFAWVLKRGGHLVQERTHRRLRLAGVAFVVATPFAWGAAALRVQEAAATPAMILLAVVPQALSVLAMAVIVFVAAPERARVSSPSTGTSRDAVGESSSMRGGVQMPRTRTKKKAAADLTLAERRKLLKAAELEYGDRQTFVSLGAAATVQAGTMDNLATWLGMRSAKSNRYSKRKKPPCSRHVAG